MRLPAADAGGGSCVMYAGVNGPPVTEHPSVGRSTSSVRQAGPDASSLTPADRCGGGGRSAVLRVNSPFSARPSGDGRRSSGRDRALTRPYTSSADTLNEATNQPFPTTSGLFYDRDSVSKHMSLKLNCRQRFCNRLTVTFCYSCHSITQTKNPKEFIVRSSKLTGKMVLPNLGWFKIP